jgi:hypothetical protein
VGGAAASEDALAVVVVVVVVIVSWLTQPRKTGLRLYRLAQRAWGCSRMT